MIKGSQLVGRAVIDMEAAERLGKVKEIIVQRDGERVAGFVVVHGETLVGTAGKRRMIPASAVHSIGPDAMTVRGSAMQQVAELDNLPRLSDIIGHKMVTRSGRLLGVIDDVLINRADGTIVGFVVGEGVRSKLENIFNPQRSRVHGYVRAEADLHVGKDLIVVPDDALIEGEPAAQESDQKSPMAKTGEADSRGWEERASAESTRPSIWTRRTVTPSPTRPETPAEPHLKSETARAVSETARPATLDDEKAPDIGTAVTTDEAVTTVPRDEAVTTIQQDQPVK
ncbi:MAG TPA: PRC-barrel domain-containing protein [Candidatus Udaeobacter sp.]